VSNDPTQLLVGTQSLELIARTIVDADARLELATSSGPDDVEDTDGELPVISVRQSGLTTDTAIDLEIVEELGRGGMASVFRARQRSINRDVAIKRANNLRPGAAAALLYEAKIAGALEHPNIVPVHLVGRDAAGRTVIVMKRIAGTTWGALLRRVDDTFWKARSRDRLRFNIETMIHVCNAVAFAHAQGVLHRDIKPANVMIGEFGEVYLVDWGIAVRKDNQGDGSIVGTPAYMAPETLARQPVDERTDVYLLGATLHEALTGRPRHVGSTVPDVLRSVAESAPVKFPADVPEELATICNRATHRDPALRFASAADLRRALEAYLVHRASNDLVSHAAATLALLDAPLASGTDLEKMRVRFVECRFGFQGALAQWPKNAAARAGLRRAIERMFELELEHGNIEAAETLLKEAETLGAPYVLRERLDAAVAEYRPARTRADTGRPSARPSGRPSARPSSRPSGRPSERPSGRPSSERSRPTVSQDDLEMSPRTRAMTIAVVCVALGFITLTLGEVVRGGGVEITNRLGVVFNLGLFAFASLGRSLILRRVRDTVYNVSMLDVLQAFVAGTVALRGAAWYLDVAPLVELRFEAVASAMVLSTLAIAVDRTLSRAAVFCAACAAGSVLVSSLTFEFVLLGQLAPIAWIVVSQYCRAAPNQGTSRSSLPARTNPPRSP
jgi:serine/threonine-protein kinase